MFKIGKSNVKSSVRKEKRKKLIQLYLIASLSFWCFAFHLSDWEARTRDLFNFIYFCCFPVMTERWGVGWGGVVLWSREEIQG